MTVTSADFLENILELVVNKDAFKQNSDLYLNFTKKYFDAVNDKLVLVKAALPRMKLVGNEVQVFFKRQPNPL